MSETTTRKVTDGIKINARTIGKIEAATGIRLYGQQLQAGIEEIAFSFATAARAAFAAGAGAGESEEQFLERVTPNECAECSDAILEGVARFQPESVRAAMATAIENFRKLRTGGA